MFYYEDGEDVSTFSVPAHVPIFLDQLSDDTIADATEVCGSIDNIECIFDFSQTGDLALAMSTMETNNQNNEDQMAVGRLTMNLYNLQVILSLRFNIQLISLRQ